MDINSLHFKGLDFSKKGQYTKAIETFNVLLNIDQKNADVYCDRGVAKFHTDDLIGSLEDMNKALDLEPENAFRYASRAYIRARSGDTAGAIEDYERALKLDPENAVSHNNLGLLQEKLGYMEMAKKRYKVADELTNMEVSEDNRSYPRERDKKINDLLSELNIPVAENRPKATLISQMKKVFTSRDERLDFWNFIKGFFKS